MLNYANEIEKVRDYCNKYLERIKDKDLSKTDYTLALAAGVIISADQLRKKFIKEDQLC